MNRALSQTTRLLARLLRGIPNQYVEETPRSLINIEYIEVLLRRNTVFAVFNGGWNCEQRRVGYVIVPLPMPTRRGLNIYRVQRESWRRG